MKHAILVGIRNEELTKKLISMPTTATLEEVKLTCRAFEAAKKTTTELKAPQTSVRAVSNYKKQKMVAAKQPQPKKSYSQEKNPSFSSRCKNCGQQHHSDTCKAASHKCRNCAKTGHFPYTAACPALAKECRVCYKFGHYDVCCAQKKSKGTRESKDLKENKLNTVKTSSPAIRSVALRPQGCPSPPINLHVAYGGKSGKINVIPDTGADTTVFGVQHLQALGIGIEELRPPPELQFSNADGSPMEGKVLGSMEAMMTYGNISYKGYIDVLSFLPTPLLCYDALRHLRIIPWDFPRQMQERKLSRTSVGTSQVPASQVIASETTSVSPPPATMSPEEARQYFLKEYSDVLMTKEQFHQGAQLKPMTGPPMRIHLKEDAKPFAIYTPRTIPLAFQEDVKTELEAMVAQGIIEPVGDQPSPWCHPLVVVPKPTGGVRVTTDLSKLNSQVQRPAHPSPSPFSAIRSLNPTSRYFSTMDALCWQIPLAEEDQALTTFITPYGRYRYRRSPMGFSASGDAYCRRGDVALQGIQNCVKVVDDILVYDRDYYSHLCRVNKVCHVVGLMVLL
ncbi:uncharacterized protein LOC135202891 [Macrobrachium nipponense]|uniref:uncharacterized protein LOC135202891 n=1 Tax=Macrobrachium nipponense TaxID=159736 RepID=UPI0030C83C75